MKNVILHSSENEYASMLLVWLEGWKRVREFIKFRNKNQTQFAKFYWIYDFISFRLDDIFVVYIFSVGEQSKKILLKLNFHKLVAIFHTHIFSLQIKNRRFTNIFSSNVKNENFFQGFFFLKSEKKLRKREI